MYRFLNEKELKDYDIKREHVLEFYKKNAGKIIPEKAIIAFGKNHYGSEVVKVDNGILVENGIFSESSRPFGMMSLFKKINIDEKGNLLFEFD